MPQSKELTEFYRAYAKWLDDEAPTDEPIFYRGYGLCASLYDYAYHHRMTGIEEVLLKELRDQFEAANFRTAYPFNKGDFWRYRDETKNSQAHLNPARIQWVREHCNG